jgi:serine/threonine protein phosphatase PrpC
MTGDRLMLCSDGIHGVVPHSVIQELLGARDSVEHSVQCLVSLANDEGGPDNISCILIEYSDGKDSQC